MNEERARALVRRLLRAVRKEEDEVSYGMMAAALLAANPAPSPNPAPPPIPAPPPNLARVMALRQCQMSHLDLDPDTKYSFYSQIKEINPTNPVCRRLAVQQLEKVMDKTKIFEGILQEKTNVLQSSVSDDELKSTALKNAYEEAMEVFKPEEVIEIAIQRGEKINFISLALLLPYLREKYKFNKAEEEKEVIAIFKKLGYDNVTLDTYFELKKPLLVSEPQREDIKPGDVLHVNPADIKPSIQYILQKLKDQLNTTIARAHESTIRQTEYVISLDARMRLLMSEMNDGGIGYDSRKPITLDNISDKAAEMWSNIDILNMIVNHLRKNIKMFTSDAPPTINEQVRQITTVLLVLFFIPGDLNTILTQIETNSKNLLFSNFYVDRFQDTYHLIQKILGDDTKLDITIEESKKGIQKKIIDSVIASIPTESQNPPPSSESMEEDTDTGLGLLTYVPMVLCVVFACVIVMATIISKNIGSQQVDWRNPKMQDMLAQMKES